MKKTLLSDHLTKSSSFDVKSFFKGLLLICFLLAFTFQTALANGGIGYKGVYINYKGTKTWYKAHNVAWGYSGCTDFSFNGAADFNGQNLGSLTSSEALQIAGFAVVGWTDNSDWVAGKLLYRVWKQGDTEPGTWSEIYVGNYGNGNGASQVVCSSGSDRIVGYNNGITNINPGAPGTYNIKIQALGRMQWSGGFFNVNDGTEVTATFTVTSSTTDYFRTTTTGNWNSTATWESSSNNTNWATSTLVPGSSAAGITILNGHNVTLNTDATISGLTVNAGGTFTASDATARTLTISKSASGSSATLTNNGTWATGSGASTIVFTGAPSSGDAVHAISGTIAFQNITVNKTGGSSNVGASFGANASVSGTLEIGSGGFISTAPPASFYGANAILKFNQGSGATYDVNEGDYSWSTTVVPNYITISSGTVNIKSDRTATGNLLIDGGDLVLDGTINPTLTINGNWTRTSGSFTANSGTVVLGGATNSTITLSTTGSMTNLTISKTSGAKVILDGSLNTTTTTLNAGSKLDINSGKTLSATTLNLKSTQTDGTATIVNNGTITATTTNVEQYLGSARNWYISSPLTATNSPATNITRYYEYVEPGNNADLSVTGSTAYWKGYNAGHAMTAGKGYIAQASAATTFTFTTSTGSLNNGNVTTPTLTRTGAANKPGYNLIGNPYPSYLDVDGFSASSLIFPTYWVRSYNSNYVFDTYNIPSALSTGLSGKSVTRYIPPMQAFWVKLKTDQSSGTLQFTNAMRAHKDAANNIFRAPRNNSSAVDKLIRIQLQSNSNIDEALIYDNPNAANNFDAFDSQKWFNNVDTLPEIYTLVDDERLVINGYNSIQLNTEIPLGFRTGITDMNHLYKLKIAEIKNINNETELVLRDKNTQTETVLNEATEYSFSSDVVNSTGRFSLILRAKGTTTGNCCYGTIENKIRIRKNNVKQLIVDCNDLVTRNTSVTVFNAAGQKIAYQLIDKPSTTLNGILESGVYIISVQNEGKSHNVKITI